MVSKIKRSKKLFVLLSRLDCNAQGPAGRQSFERPRLAGMAAHSPRARGWDWNTFQNPGPGR